MHGFGTNKEFMKMQAGLIEAQLKELAEFIFIDGPVVVPKDVVFDSNVFKHLKGHTRSWFGINLSNNLLKKLKQVVQNKF